MSRSLKADQVSAAFNAVPGVFIDALAFVPGGNITTTSALFVDLTGASGTFTAPSSGDYVLDIQLTCFSPNVGTATGFQVVIDAGESAEKTIGVDNASWRVPHANANEQHFWNQRALVSDLAAGSHTFKVQWKAVSGGTQYLDAGSHINISLQSISGSGAAGVLLSLKEKTADQTGIAQNVTTLLTELSHTITVAANEYFVLEYMIIGSSASNRTDALLYRVDSGSWLPLEAESASSGYWNTLSGSKTIQLSVGSHTIDFALAQDGPSTLTVWGVGSYQGVTWRSWTAIRQYRGGQIPWEVDGSEVLSTPSAINIDGATVDYSVGDGKLNLSLPKAVTAPGINTSILDNDAPSATTTSATFVDVAGGSATFDAPQAGDYLIKLFVGGVWANSTNSNAIWRIDVDSGDQVTPDNGRWQQTLLGNVRQEFYAEHKFTLTAGTHTFKLQWRRWSGSGTFTLDTSSYIGLDAEAITGSGAGGVIVASSEATDVAGDIVTNSYIWPTVLDFTGLSATVDVAEGEQLMVQFSGSAIDDPNTGFTYPYVGVKVDGTVKHGIGHQLQAQYYGNNASFSYVTDPLTAGSHTIQICGWKADGAHSDWKLWSNSAGNPMLFVTQFRGGLVPITDGYTTVDKPIAQEFINGTVTESGGKAIITLPEAVTKQGELIELFGSTTEPSSNVNSPVGDTQILPWPSSFPGGSSEPSEPFTVQGGGTYRVTLTARQYVQTAQELVLYRVVFDENESNEQTIGNDLFWRVNSFATTFQHITLEGQVTLTAGAHTAKVYGYCDTADRWRHITPSTDGIPPKLTLEAIVGSGAGGSLLYSDMSTGAPPDDTATTWHDFPRESGGDPIEVEIECVRGDILKATMQGTNVNPSGSSLFMDIRMKLIHPDASETFSEHWRKKYNSVWEDKSWNHVWRWEITTPGTYKVRIQWYKSSSSLGMSFWDNQQVIVDVERGGLVPHKNDNVLVQDKPVAVNYLGPGLQATDVGGQVNVSVQSAAEGVEYSEDVLGSNTALAADPTYTDLASVTINTAEGEYVIAHYNAQGVTGSTNATMFLRMDIDGTPESWRVTSQSVSGNSFYTSGDGAVVLGPLSGGSHTIKLQGAYVNAAVTVSSTHTRLGISRLRGGYVTPENVPELVYNGTSTVYASPRAGASDRLWLVLSDGKRYYADGSQLLDMTASGLGGLDTGSEASSTWYYVYAVPTSTSGVFDVTASATDPDSGGPTGFDAWRYLGSFYNNSSGNIRPFFQSGSWFEQDVDDDDLVVLDANPDQVTTWTSLDISAAAPPTVYSAVQVGGWIDSDSSQVLGVFVEAATPTYNPSTETNAYKARAILASHGDGQDTGTRVVHTTQGLVYQLRRWQGTGTCNVSLIVRSFRDRYLGGEDAQTQAQYLPDTKRIVLTYASSTSVTVSPRGGTAIRLTLQDGKQRTVSAAQAFNPSLGAADGGLDTGTEASSTWYYVYLVPKSGDDNSLAVRGSTSPPATGPTGYSNYWYVGPVRNDGSSDLVEFTQVGLDRFRYRDLHSVYANTAPPTSWTALDLSGDLPATCQVARLAVELYYTNSGGGGVEILELRRTGDTNTSRKLFWDADTGGINGATLEADIEVSTSRSVDHQWTRNETFSGCTYYLTEFTDDYAGEATQ
ncbi:MAG: hypothetical protein GWN58_23575 [Anaerolineae bacterium]|nr:hypothetical protein [Thermoplasmata archaeon]NIV32312.1 hypothetical protein [Anaerolineae bacterium]NIY03766.1 hypothetical protein [Thermoplasmata archaeon]